MKDLFPVKKVPLYPSGHWYDAPRLSELESLTLALPEMSRSYRRKVSSCREPNAGPLCASGKMPTRIGRLELFPPGLPLQFTSGSGRNNILVGAEPNGLTILNKNASLQFSSLSPDKKSNNTNWFIIHFVNNLQKKTLLAKFAKVSEHYTDEGLGN